MFRQFRSESGFTLVELLTYGTIFAITAGLLTVILSNAVRVTNREGAGTEVSQQLNFVLDTVQRLVGQASLIEAVYEGENSAAECTDFCTLALRMNAIDDDPTYIKSDASGVYLKQGTDATSTLTSSKVTVDYLRFTKFEFEGGHASARVDLSLTFNTDNPKFAVTRTLQSALGRVNAAIFDDHLLPNTDSTYDVGQTTGSKRWRGGAFSNDLTVGGKLSVGTTTSTYTIDVDGAIRATGALLLGETSAPSGVSNHGQLYVNSSDNGLYYIDENGSSTAISSRSDTKCIWFENPTEDDDFDSIWKNGTAGDFTLTEMWCESDQTVNLDLQVDDGSPADVNGSDLSCTASEAEDTSLSGDTTLAAGEELDLVVTSVSGSPTWVSVCWTGNW